MTTFHVLLDVEKPGHREQWVPVFSDLSEEDLKARFVEPYLAGREIRSAKGPLQRPGISMVRIIRTEGGYEQALDAYRRKQWAAEEEFMRTSGMALPPYQHPAADLTVVGTDVTADYIPAA